MTAPDQTEDLLKPEHELPAHATHSHSEHEEKEHHYNEVKTLLSWEAPGRPFRKRHKSYFINVSVIATLCMIISFLFSQFFLALVIASLVFVIFALNTVPPHNFRYKISSEGITIEDHFFLWQELYDFYFNRTEGHDTLQIRTKAFIPGELTIPLGDLTKDHVRSILLSCLPYRETIKKTFTEKSADWLSRNFPLERT